MIVTMFISKRFKLELWDSAISYEYPIIKKHFYIIFNTKINKYQPINCYLP